MKKIRTRYAPSPTGFLHIGGARSALFTYLFAKVHNGDFLIRIEDTDLERNVDKGEESQIQNLEWLGIVADESPVSKNQDFGPYRQSERLELYREYAQKLLDQGYAYEAFDTSEELKKQKDEYDGSFRYDRNWLKISEEEKEIRRRNNQVSLRFKLPKNKDYTWNDQVRGKVTFNSDEISEFVILKSNGVPTYAFANVIDDHFMEISHVHRGEEHLANTPKQLAMYEAFGWTPPEYGHMTIITNMEGKKLSKRDNTLKQFIEQYRNEGYLPAGILNFLALLGWSHSQAKEILSHEQLVKDFDISRLSKSPSKFDEKKMQWISNKYMQELTDEAYIEKAKSFLTTIPSSDRENWLETLLLIFKKQVYAFSELNELIIPFINDLPLENKEEISTPEMQEVISAFYESFKEIKEYTIENIVEAINKTKEKTTAKGKKFFMPIRIATTHVSHGPELAKAIWLFEKEKVLKRLENCLI
ncbi:MAG: glutamate--tRNA ligase [Mycoplasma sp.]|nr:glutamate--tRNA ligase [Mycoplasma sp.]